MSKRRACNVKVHVRYNESQERAIKRFIKKTREEKIVEKCIELSFYEKPSVKNKRKKLKRKKILRERGKFSRDAA